MAFSLLPVEASTISVEVDRLLFFLLAVGIFFTAVIFAAIAYFALRYRRRSEHELPGEVHGAMALEIAWSVIPFGLTLVMFAWGASVFFQESRPPDDSLQVYVVAKQWMWKLQHVEGPREINELHIPLGRPVKLTMTSEDAIHSFYVPAFRTKQDVLPGRYTTTWFQPTKVGKYHLFCAEYCGTNHSGMTGWIYVMEPRDYQSWLNGSPSASLAENGRRLFDDLACGNCHKTDGTGRCPSLAGLYGKTVHLTGGGSAKADEDYIRESILQPAAKVVAGFEPNMPVYQGQVTEEGVLQLVAYIKSLASQAPASAAIGAAATGNR
ncbi:MAG: cytochrome c oxidase subunit II [Bryobacteraceae bacterium]|jgi:cytochrome c oxidase subunit 2